MKRVYKIRSLDEIGSYNQGLSGYHVVIMFIGSPSSQWAEIMANYPLIHDGNYYYYQLNYYIKKIVIDVISGSTPYRLRGSSQIL